MPLAAAPESPLVRRLGLLVAGLLLVAVGVALTIRAEVGVAPYDVLTTGLVALTGVPIGVAAMLLPLVFVGLGAALGGRPGPGTLIAVLVVGPVLGVVLDALPEHEALVVRVPIFAIGFLLVAAGITLVVVAELGPGPAELLMLALHDRGHPLAPTRTAIEVASILIGWAMGGQVGVGTIVFALLIGVTLRWMLHAAGYPDARVTAASDAAAPGA